MRISPVVGSVGDSDEDVLDALQGPALNLGSPETELAAPLLDLVREMLSADSAYVARIKAHYRLFRAEVDRREALTGFADPEQRTRSGRQRRG